jgi:hypothetical protein
MSPSLAASAATMNGPSNPEPIIASAVPVPKSFTRDIFMSNSSASRPLGLDRYEPIA